MAGYSGTLTSAQIEAIVNETTRRLVEASRPARIVLFGSFARGDFDGDSDLDLLVVLPEVEDRLEEMVRLRRVLKGIPMPIDIVVYSEHEVEERRNLRGTMLYHALREGRVLHDAT